MKRASILLSIVFLLSIVNTQAQVVQLTAESFSSNQLIPLSEIEGWYFKSGSDSTGIHLIKNSDGWSKLRPVDLSPQMADKNGRIEGWFHLKIKLGPSLEGIPIGINRELWAATDIYVDGELLHSFGDIGNPYKAFNPILKHPIPIDLIPEREYLLTIHFVDYETTFTQREIRLKPENLTRFINLTGPDFISKVNKDYKKALIYGTLSIGISFLLFLLFWLLVILTPTQKIFILIATLSTIVFLYAVGLFFNNFFEITYTVEKTRFFATVTLQAISVIFGLFILEWVLTNKISIISKFLLVIITITSTFAHLFSVSIPFGIAFTVMLVYFGYLIYTYRQEIKGARLAVVAAMVVPLIANFVYINLHKFSLDLFYEYEKLNYAIIILSAPLFLLVYISVQFKEILNSMEAEASKVLRITEEKRELLANQNILLENQVSERTASLNQSIKHLKATQSQLVQSEKMASLGELTAGIAHEIQNPLNFVNNFSEVSGELLDEVLEELEEGNIDDVKEIISDLKQNLEKIHHHGGRADSIVKGMLQHSRTSSGEKSPTDINELADEYLRLAYHGLRAKDNTFNAAMETDFDKSIGKINVIPQDIGRVLLNLITNAFQACADRSKTSENGFKPKVDLTTNRLNDSTIEIIVADNGVGIPENIKDKIFQPFFTTKPTGQGTGLGLSLSYDIVNAHGGELIVESEEGQGTKFVIKLPVV